MDLYNVSFSVADNFADTWIGFNENILIKMNILLRKVFNVFKTQHRWTLNICSLYSSLLFLKNISFHAFKPYSKHLFET